MTIYRLVTKGTYEEQLLSTANQKYGLNEAILGNINAVGNPEDNAKRIAELLRNGAYSLLNDGGAAAAQTEEFEREDIQARHAAACLPLRSEFASHRCARASAERERGAAWCGGC